MVRRRIARGDPGLPTVNQVCDVTELLLMRKNLEQVEVSDEVIGYAAAIVAATRVHPKVTVGASPRGTLALVQLARAAALLDGRGFAIPEDVKALAPAVLAHRIGLRPEVWVRRVDPEAIIAEVLDQVPVPRTERRP
ncbi:AAA family ATPase [Segeticoccus rhizosphaerae]|uniref:AAA family ATPase n=1 Tax=Segeticoccus rhizosphaerae TaxID=1104777 RepID=UPI00308340E8